MFEWDEGKSSATLTARGFDFDFATRIFEGDVVEEYDERREYGERRVLAVGQVEGQVLTVVYTWRGDRRRIISARRANRREREEYRDSSRA